MSANLQRKGHKSSTDFWSKWANRLLSIFLLVALPLLYYVHILDKDWINRIGLILNFCAGFMVAPDLIGSERLSRLESKSEESLGKAQFTLNKQVEKFREISKLSDFTIFALEVFFVVLFILIPIINGQFFKAGVLMIALYGVLVFISLLFISNDYMMDQGVVVSSNIVDKRKYLKLLLPSFVYAVRQPKAMLGSLPVSILFGTTSYVFILVYSFMLLLSIRFINYVIGTLSGDERLRAILVWWGVIFFIVGNLLQFLATF